MGRRVAFLIVAILSWAVAHPAAAQQAKKVPRIGLLFIGAASSVAPYTNAFRLGLRELGYVEGQNLAIEHRFAEGKLDRLPELAAELVRVKVNVIVVSSTPAVLAAKKATKEVPVVFYTISDPVAEGVVASLARPGGNLTGMTLGG
ncbi:MAG: ABC transporter substrate binding protein, partial [Methylocella sp.]